jgi:hypothetical protein
MATKPSIALIQTILSQGLGPFGRFRGLLLHRQKLAPHKPLSDQSRMIQALLGPLETVLLA